MFLQLSFFVASVIFSIALTLLTIPVPLHVAEWEISTNSYLVTPNSDDLIIGKHPNASASHVL
jgi:hypothetical protein